MLNVRFTIAAALCIIPRITSSTGYDTQPTHEFIFLTIPMKLCLMQPRYATDFVKKYVPVNIIILNGAEVRVHEAPIRL